MSRLPPTGPQWLTYVGVCGHIVWCNAKGVGNREIVVTYSNSVSKTTSETDIFPHGPKSLLISVISDIYIYILQTQFFIERFVFLMNFKLIHFCTHYTAYNRWNMITEFINLFSFIVVDNSGWRVVLCFCYTDTEIISSKIGSWAEGLDWKMH